MNTHRLWVLGAPDPEMVLIEGLLRRAGEAVEYARGSSGQRVAPGNAYAAAGPYMYGGHPATDGGVTYLVECGYSDGGPHIAGIAFRVDHHWPGDPGYGLPPAQFWQASSLGQVHRILHDLGIPVGEPNAEMLYAAAADHCLAAAYRGACPGIEPDALMRWRVQIRAEHQRRDVESLERDVEYARASLRAAPKLCVAGVAVADLRGQSVPELPEAAARDGIPFLASVSDRDGRQKIVLQSAPPEVISEFMGGNVVRGLVDCYGDPARGFAGGYLGNPDETSN